MGLFQQQLDKELSKEKKDNRLIASLTGVIANGCIVLDEWRESGRFINRDDFSSERPEENLHIDCTDVVKYYGDIYIQVLKNGDFFVDASFQSPDVKLSEEVIWRKYADQMW